MRFRRSRVALPVAVVAGLVAIQAASADKLPVQYNAADQAAARAVVLKRGDLGTATGWKAVTAKPDFSSSTCGGYEPKRSDLTVTGASASEWRNGSALVSFQTETWVMKTAAMVRVDWQRVVGHPTFLRCSAEKDLATQQNAKLVSYKRIAFPRLAPLSRRVRLVVDYAVEGQTLRMLFDLVLLGKGRTEISLLTVGPYAARSDIDAAEVRLARLLLRRATV